METFVEENFSANLLKYCEKREVKLLAKE